MVPCKTCPIRVASAFLSLQIKTLLRLQIAKHLVSQKSVRCHDVQTCQKLKAPRRSGAQQLQSDVPHRHNPPPLTQSQKSLHQESPPLQLAG